MNKKVFFPYYWIVDEEEREYTIIRIYGLDIDNKSVCVMINDFTPYVYLELPDNINWTIKYAQLIINTINDKLKEKRPVVTKLVYKKRLYGVYKDIENEDRLFPYIFLAFYSVYDIASLRTITYRPIYIDTMGFIKLKMHEDNANPRLQLSCLRGISPADWIEFDGNPKIKKFKITTCDNEYQISWKDLNPNNDIKTLPKPLILSFDIEVNSSVNGSMPKYFRPDDKIFQISMVLGVQGSEPKTYKKFLITLGEPDKQMGEDIEIIYCFTEAELLSEYSKFIKKYNPNIIIGYNIFEFDIDYMIKRSKEISCVKDFFNQGFNKNVTGKVKEISWSSSAYKNQKFLYLDSEGRLFIDMLPVIRRNYSFSVYKLKTVADFFLGETKDPLTAKGIFKCYKLGMKGWNSDNCDEKVKGTKAMSIVGKYCVQDSVLVLKIFEKTQTWISLVEMAKVCNTEIFHLFTQGQQLKIFQQVYKKCFDENYVVEKNAYICKDNEQYTGAHVFDPIKGVHDDVIPLDFCLTGDTLVNLSNGYSKKLKNFIGGEKILCYNEELKTITESEVLNLQIKGEKETIKIFLQDGRTVECTPDHKFLCDDGTWVEAQFLENKYVLCGPQNPKDKIKDDENNWNLGDFNLKEKREQTLAFSRILGYLLSDGCIYKSNRRCCAEAYLGTLIDAEMFLEDIKKIIPTMTKIRKRNGNNCKGSEIKGQTYVITLPEKLANIIHKLKNIIIGKRCSQKMQLPDFINSKYCPLSIIREFLAGLFGGDATAPYYQNSGKFGYISFKWTIIEKYKESMNLTMKNIIDLLYRFNIQCNLVNCVKVKYEKNSIKPKDYLINPRWDYYFSIKNDYTYLFANLIGFRYCINKNYKLNIVSLFIKMSLKVRDQFNFVINTTNDFIKEKIGDNTLARKKGQVTFKDCLDLARKELTKNEIPLNNLVLASVNNINYFRGEIQKGKTRRISLRYRKGFINETRFLEETDTKKWFNKREYIIKNDSKKLPTFKQKVIGIKNNGIKKVYDIEVKDHHNFIANGTIVHNCSLYPSIMIAYNICFSTWVEDNSNIPDEDCNIIEWDDHYNCSHDTTKRISKKVICVLGRRYRFIKEPLGVLPSLLKNLLDARNNVKKQIKDLSNEIKNNLDPKQLEDIERTMVVLDKQQLALKVSCNSVYGAMGVKRGKLPFMPGAMCVTAIGRKSIKKVAKIAQEKHNATLIYGDTDSTYLQFPWIKTKGELWDHSIEVAKDITTYFPNPMNLAFEYIIYTRFLILTKKRYMSLTCGKDGVVSKEINSKGVMLKRRDNSKVVRDIYKNIIMNVFNKIPKEIILNYLIDNIMKLFTNFYEISEFIITKSVGEINEYKIRPLPTDPIKRKMRLKYLKCDEQNYCIKALPANAQLLLKMQSRGENVGAGTRLEFVIIDIGDIKAKNFEKIEDANYFIRNSSILKLDYLYYVKQLVIPIDQVLESVYGIKNYVDGIYKKLKVTYELRKKVIQDLNEYNSPIKLVE